MAATTTPHLTDPAALGVEHHHAVVNGIRMHYVSAGLSKGRGPLVLLLHGFPEMWWSWRYQIKALAAAGFRVVAPDLRGYADTEVDGPFDLDTLRADVLGLLDHLGAQKATLVAHDWGGMLAWHIAATAEGAPRVERLVVMNCPHPVVFGKALFGKISQMRRSWYIGFFQIPLVPERLLTAFGGRAIARTFRSMAVDKSRFGDQEIAPIVQAARKPGRAHAMIGWYRAAMRARLERQPRYQPITVPTMLVWGLEDTALGFDDVVPGTERWAPDLKIETIPRCGHFVQQEQPEAVNRLLLSFLGKKPH